MMINDTHAMIQEPCTVISETYVVISELFSHHTVLIPIPVVRAAFIISLADPVIIVLIHLAVTVVFFILFIIRVVGAGIAKSIHYHSPYPDALSFRVTVQNPAGF